MLRSLIPWKKQQNNDLSVGTYEPLIRFRQEFDQLWDRFWSDPFGSAMTPFSSLSALSNPVEFDDREQEYVLIAKLPGYEPDDFEVTVSGNVLTLRAEHKEEKKNGNGSYRHYGSYSQSFTLPESVEADRIDARYHSGVLEVHLPKNEACRAKRIEVKAD